MVFYVKLSTIFHCSLEQAFKMPMLGDVTKVHTGYFIMPAVSGTSDDKEWGSVGSSKKVYVAKSLTQKGGFASIDRVIERIENEKWVIQVDTFQSWMLNFNKFVGIWQTTELEPLRIRTDYHYALHTSSLWLWPLNYLFATLFWKAYMKRVLENVRRMIKRGENYQYP
jgi:hypothetical protein